MQYRICALAREGRTVVLSGRWLWPAKDVCGRMAILFRGQIQAAGALAQLLAAPDAIRIIGPVLPPANAEKVLTTMRQEILGQAGAAMEPPKPPNHPPNAETRENSIFAALTRPGLAAAPERPPAESADPVNHEKLAQLTKERSEILGRPSD
jgi:ABC-type multidrug transport system ATPase subunit